MPEQYNPIILAIPFFFLLIGVELAISFATRKKLYNLCDSIGSLGTGVLDQVLESWSSTLVTFSAYILIYQKLSFQRLDDHSPLTWAIAFAGTEFAYYWWHRLSHTVNFMWAAHVVHHQSENYNLTTALRQNWLTTFTGAPFYWPLAFIGVSPLVFFYVKSFAILYQFWIHTQLIGKLGPLEEALNTPSLHRVHHAINPQYLDKNFGATTILWDRLFGTFTKEKEKPIFGTLKPLRSWNPLKAYADSWIYTAAVAEKLPRLSDRLKIWFLHPGAGASNQDLTAAFKKVRSEPYSVKLSPKNSLFAALQFLIILGAAVAFLALNRNLSRSWQITFPLIVVLAMSSVGRFKGEGAI